MHEFDEETQSQLEDLKIKVQKLIQAIEASAEKSEEADEDMFGV